MELLDVITSGAARYEMRRSMGTLTSPTAVTDDTWLGQILFYGYAGATDKSQQAASITAKIDGTVDDNPFKMPGRLEFHTTGTEADGIPITALTLDSSQNATFAGAVDLGTGVIFPTSDPAVAGQWWDDAGTLTKSSG